MNTHAAQHSAVSGEQYTPQCVVEPGRLTMGQIDLDPFSSALANTVVNAGMFYTLPANDGFAEPWGDETDPQAVFCNPPGDKVKRQPARAHKPLVKPGQAHAWWKLIDEYEAGRVREAIFVCFNLGVFQTAQRFGYPAPSSFPFCVPKKRLRFWSPTRAPGKGAPSHSNAVVYLPPRLEWAQDGAAGDGAQRFAQAFGELGEVRL